MKTLGGQKTGLPFALETTHELRSQMLCIRSASAIAKEENLLSLSSVLGPPLAKV